MVQRVAGVYRHYKGGTYTVIMMARCSDNGTNEGKDVVVYVSHTTGKVCTRMASEFFGMVGGDGVKRFEFVADALAVPT